MALERLTSAAAAALVLLARLVRLVCPRNAGFDQSADEMREGQREQRERLGLTPPFLDLRDLLVQMGLTEQRDLRDQRDLLVLREQQGQQGQQGRRVLQALRDHKDQQGRTALTVLTALTVQTERRRRSM